MVSLPCSVVQTTSMMSVSSPPRLTSGGLQLPPSGDRILSFSPMQVVALLVPLPAPMVVSSQSPAFRRGTSSALAGSRVHKRQTRLRLAARLIGALLARFAPPRKGKALL